jgi:redox-sensitive bicupin YhaK (pirin superfamily)
MKKLIFHQANTRGEANHGWLKSFHSFSFANYYNPERMNFGVLRVLNDDTVSGGMGFGKHQVMSAGTGVYHSEYNKNKDETVKFLQIWVFPNKKNVTPRYDQISLNIEERKNRLQQILSPNAEDEGVWIHQDAWFHLGNFDKGQNVHYQMKKEGNGLYAFILKGSFVIDQQEMGLRDGLGITGTDQIDIIAREDDAEILLMEVPMNLN